MASATSGVQRTRGSRDDAAGTLLHDDSALARVPESEKRGWVPIMFIRLGMISALTQFLVAAVVGYNMDFGSAFWATLIATIILEAVFILMGIAGAWEGLNLSVLARWAGFGRYGSALVGLATAVSLTGWFGVQNGLFAESLRNAVHGVVPLWLCEVVSGLFVTLLVAYGFSMLRWTAYVAVPAFFVLAAGDVIYLIATHDALRFITAPTPGPTMSIAQGATVVVGALISGAIIAPDYARYNRTARDVLLQSVIGIALGEFGVGFVGFILARAVKTSDIPTIMISVNGLLGALVVMFAVVKVNDINLYSSSLGWVNVIDTVFGRKVNRAVVTLVFGAIGTLLSALGILGQFVPFLATLGVVFPPIAGVIIADYFVLRSHRAELVESRQRDALPATLPAVTLPGLAAWIIGSAVGEWVTWGIPSANALVAAGLAYLAIAALVRVTRRARTPRDMAAAASR